MRDILTAFSAQLEFYSEINEMITKRTENTIDISKEKRINFFAYQVHLNAFELQGRRYSSDTITQTLNLFLRSTNGNNSLP